LNDLMDRPAAPRSAWAEIFLGRYAVHTFILNLGMTLYAINQFVVATLMPTVVAELGGVDFYTWAFSLFAVGGIIGSASAGPLRVALGARLAYAGAGIVLGVGLVGAALAPDMPTFVLFRLIQGVGGGAVASQAYGLVAVVYPQELRGRVLSTISTVWGVATLAGPGFGGAFAAPGLWPTAFWSLAPLVLVFVALAWRHSDKARGHGRLSELPYARLALLGLAILVISGATLAIPNWARAMFIAVAVAFTGATFALDARAPHTMFPRQTAAMRTEIGATFGVLFLVSIVMAVVNTFITFFLQKLHGIEPLVAGYIAAVYSFMWTFGALIAANLAGLRERQSVLVGLVLVLAATVAIAVTVDSGPVALIVVSVGAIGFGLGLMNNPTIARIMELAPESERHVAGTSVQTIRNIGISFGSAFAGTIAAIAGLTDVSDTAEIAHAMRWVYAVNIAFALLPLLMAVAIFARWRKREA
jgi:MFS family permease